MEENVISLVSELNASNDLQKKRLHVGSIKTDTFVWCLPFWASHCTCYIYKVQCQRVTLDL